MFNIGFSELILILLVAFVMDGGPVVSCHTLASLAADL